MIISCLEQGLKSLIFFTLFVQYLTLNKHTFSDLILFSAQRGKEGGAVAAARPTRMTTHPSQSQSKKRNPNRGKVLHIHLFKRQQILYVYYLQSMMYFTRCCTGKAFAWPWPRKTHTHTHTYTHTQHAHTVTQARRHTHTPMSSSHRWEDITAHRENAAFVSYLLWCSPFGEFQIKSVDWLLGWKTKTTGEPQRGDTGRPLTLWGVNASVTAMVGHHVQQETSRQNVHTQKHTIHTESMRACTTPSLLL